MLKWFRGSFLKEDKYRVARTLIEAVLSFAINNLAMIVAKTNFSAFVQTLIVGIGMIALTALFDFMKENDNEDVDIDIYTYEELEQLTKNEIIELGKELSIKLSSRMRKNELIQDFLYKQ